MLLTEALNQMTEIKKGTFTPISYRTELPIKSSYKDSVKVVKTSKGMGRFGISYKNLPSVKAKGDSGKKSNPNEMWVVKNIIKYNKNTKKFYLVVYTVNATNAKTKSTYNVIDKITGTVLFTTKNKNDLKEYVISSYFKPSEGDRKEIYCVNLDNIIKVGK